MTARDDFPRTTCACETCRAGCMTQPGMVGSGDIDRICDHAFVPKDERGEFIATHFCASEGALVAQFTDLGIKQFRIPTIVPQQKADGRCVFLYLDGRCGIHPVAPIGCSHCDTHTPRGAGGSDVMHAALVEIMGDAVYRAQHSALLAVGAKARPLAERKAAYAALEAEIRARTANVTPQV